MTTEDPNIATLREAHRRIDNNGDCWWLDVEAIGKAIDALSTTLAEKEERIRELDKLRADAVFALRESEGHDPSCDCDWHDALAARLAVPEGDLAEQREKLWALIRNYRNECAGDLVGVAGGIGRIVDPLFESAAKWQRLQWRKASEAPRDVRVLFVGCHPTMQPFVCIGARHPARAVWVDEDTQGGLNIEWRDGEVLGWLPLDALPPAPTGGTDG